MDLLPLATEVVGLLADRQAKVVLAESCTAGLIAASLGGVPGVSRFLCGSAVVYREQTKIDWLDVDATVIKEFTAVSEAATKSIALGVLQNTAEATFSLGITGHLGPGSPDELDGKIFVALGRRTGESIKASNAEPFQLTTVSRIDRQREATSIALTQLKRAISEA